MDLSRLVMLLQQMRGADPYQNKDSRYESLSRGYGAPNPIYEKDAQGNYWITQHGVRKKIDPRMFHPNRLIY